MSIDYDGIGGVGILLTQERLNSIFSNGLFDNEAWEIDFYSCLEIIGLSYAIGGDSYAGIYRPYLFVEGNTLGDIITNVPNFLNKLSEIGININMEDIEIISDIHVY